MSREPKTSRWALSLPARGLWLLAIAAGCSSQPAEQRAVEPTARIALPLRVLVIDDPELSVVIQREWDSRTGAHSKIAQLTSAEFLAQPRERLGADVVVYPGGLLGELAERSLISPLDARAVEDVVFDRPDLLPLTRLHEISWGEQVYAVPFGSPQFTLFYRADIFSALGLAPPTTWTEYQQLVERLADRAAVGDFAPASEIPWSGVAEPLADGWAGPWLLARAASYARHRSQYSTLFDYRTMEPLIAGPPFVRALEELSAAAKHASSEPLTLTETRRRFLAGQCAMAISWPSRADDASPETAGPRENWIGVAELPGSPDVYNFRTSQWERRAEDEDPHVTLLAVSGRLGSITAECRQTQPALGLLFLLTSRELGAQVSSTSQHTTLFRESQLGQVSLWTDRAFDGEAARQYGAALQASQSRTAWIASLSIPGRALYLAALDDAVRTVVAGQATSEDALQAAAQRWREVTDTLGQERQQRAYTRSLGLEP